jgi:hypothetical protein
LNRKDDAMTKTETHLLDLHTDLQDDPTGTRRAQVLERLHALARQCVDARRQPAERDAYSRLQAATVAVNAAIRIVEKLPKPGAGGN